MPDQETGQPPTRVKCNCNSTSGRTVLQKITPIDSMPTLDYVRYIKGKWRLESICNASLREWVFCCHAQNVLFPTLCNMHHSWKILLGGFWRSMYIWQVIPKLLAVKGQPIPLICAVWPVSMVLPESDSRERSNNYKMTESMSALKYFCNYTQGILRGPQNCSEAIGMAN